MTSIFQQIEPCPARGKWLDSYFDDSNWFFEEKLDGDRRIGQFIDGVVRFTGRNISKKDGLFVEKTDNVPHITHSALETSISPLGDEDWSGRIDQNLLARVKGLEGTVLDGECLVAQEFVDALVAAGGDIGGLSKHTTSIMGSKPGKAVRYQMERGFMRWVVFDCLYYKGKDIRALPQVERRTYAVAAVAEWDNPHVSVAKAVNGPADKRAFLDAILARPDGEGVIAKHINATYGQKNLWAKRKLEMNADVIIIGYEDAKEESEKVTGVVSKTKYHLNGWIGAVRFGQYRDGKLWYCGKMSGMDESRRIEFSQNGDKYLGRVVEIRANGREPTGKFRHPRFKQFRDDKAAEQCVYDENET